MSLVIINLGHGPTDTQTQTHTDTRKKRHTHRHTRTHTDTHTQAPILMIRAGTILRNQAHTGLWPVYGLKNSTAKFSKLAEFMKCNA